MKRKNKYIYIDGMEKTGTTSVLKQVYKSLKEQGKFLLQSENIDKLSNEKYTLLKEHGIMSTFHNDLKKLKGVKDLMVQLDSIITKERQKNHTYGVVNFFIIPENIEIAKKMFGFEKIPSYYNDLINFYKGINQTSIAEGLDIRIIPFNEHDKIFDVRDKVLKILEKEYEI